jgi:cupin 2 domain-containing protein
MVKPESIYQGIPGEIREELFEEILRSGSVRIERIVSTGQCSPEGFWYDQDMNEWVLVIKGEAKLRIEGQQGWIHLEEGMYVNIPSHVRHRVEWTPEDRETVWLAVHYGES